MIVVHTGRVRTSDARSLDRAMLLVQRGRISYTRWVETLDAWARGEDVSTWDYGDAESTPARVLALFAGRDTTTGEVRAELGGTLTAASKALSRLAERGHVRKLSHGRWRIGRSTPQVSDVRTTDKGPER